jgi:hypothetical protein
MLNILAFFAFALGAFALGAFALGATRFLRPSIYSAYAPYILWLYLWWEGDGGVSSSLEGGGGV